MLPAATCYSCLVSLSDKVKSKLQELPSKPGVYLMRDRQGRIIYVGKAASLRTRVQSPWFRSRTCSAT